MTPPWEQHHVLRPAVPVDEVMTTKGMEYRPHERRGPWVFASGVRPEIRTALGTLIGEVKKIGAMHELHEDEVEIAVANGYARSIVMKLVRSVVYFEHPEETEVVERSVASRLGTPLPNTWWDHWKHDHPHLRRRLRMAKPEYHHEVVEYRDVGIHKLYHLEGVIR